MLGGLFTYRRLLLLIKWPVRIPVLKNVTFRLPSPRMARRPDVANSGFGVRGGRRSAVPRLPLRCRHRLTKPVLVLQGWAKEIFWLSRSFQPLPLFLSKPLPSWRNEPLLRHGLLRKAGFTLSLGGQGGPRPEHRQICGTNFSPAPYRESAEA